MTYYETLDQLLKDRRGIIKLEDALALGISKPSFYNYVTKKDLEKVAPGIYLSKDDWKDYLYILHLRFEQMIFSHETALFFHDLTDREPLKYEASVKTGSNTSYLKNEGLKVYSVKPALYEVGLTMCETSFGHLIPVYDLERTICDILRNRNNMDVQILRGALRSYLHRRDKDLDTLIRDAELFRVDKILMRYLEVLL